MSLLSKRRAVGAVCPVCHSPDYKISPPKDGLTKPNIKCGSCGNIWQYGRDGGIYAENLPNKACSGFAAGRVKNKGSAKAANR